MNEKYMYLSELTTSRNNNFDILRFLAALEVLVYHSFICLGTTIPFANFIDGVPIFFAISGFLITRSWIDDPNFLAFLKKRVLRIYPAFIVVVCFTALVIGPLVTNLSIKNYFSNSMFFDYFKNFFLYKIHHFLPGVFTTTPYTSSVNASLWTLPLEFFAYILVALFGVSKIIKKQFFYPIFIVLLISIFYYFTNVHLISYRWIKLIKFVLLFFISSAMYTYRDKIKLSFVAFAVMLFLYVYSTRTSLFEYVRFFTLPYMVIYLAYSKIPYINNFGKYGDFSYGLYLWAFPVQQTLVYLYYDKLNIYSYIISTFIVTLIIAIISYKVVEKPALKLKKVKLFLK